VLEREDARDALVSLKYGCLADLPKGSRFGTSSIRRQAQLLRLRPDLEIVGFRGNVGTRLTKLANGIADATLLAAAGLNRLGLTDRIAEIISADILLPAPAQGAIAIEIRAGDEATAQSVAALDHQPTHIATLAERAFLAVLDGSCRTPIAAYAVLHEDRLTLKGEVLSPDGRKYAAATRSSSAADALRTGMDAGHEVLAQAGAGLFGARD
jgi:hydroxymethylbilane synthase